MKNAPTTDQVLGDIEFELLQGAVSCDELGQSIQAVRQFLSKTRAEVFSTDRRMANYHEIASRQFQINDMLVALLQETVAQLRSLRLELKQASRVWQGPQETQPAPENSTSEERAAGSRGIDHPDLAGWIVPPAGLGLHGEELLVEQEVRSVEIPLAGRMLTRLRAALHNLVLFYVGKLADRQTVVNQTLGDSISHLGKLLQGQQEQLLALSQQLASLQAGSQENQRSSADAVEQE